MYIDIVSFEFLCSFSIANRICANWILVPSWVPLDISSAHRSPSSPTRGLQDLQRPAPNVRTWSFTNSNISSCFPNTRRCPGSSQLCLWRTIEGAFPNSTRRVPRSNSAGGVECWSISFCGRKSQREFGQSMMEWPKLVGRTLIRRSPKWTPPQIRFPCSGGGPTDSVSILLLTIGKCEKRSLTQGK